MEFRMAYRQTLHKLRPLAGACGSFAPVAVLLCAACAFAQQDKTDKEAFESICGMCHQTTIVNEFRSEPDWSDTVDQMVKNGAKGTDEQLERVMRFLLFNWTKININSAPAPQIAAVLEVSDATAQAIVKRRAENGDFKTLEELKKIPGVDAAKLDARKERI